MNTRKENFPTCRYGWLLVATKISIQKGKENFIFKKEKDYTQEIMHIQRKKMFIQKGINIQRSDEKRTANEGRLRNMIVIIAVSMQDRLKSKFLKIGIRSYPPPISAHFRFQKMAILRRKHAYIIF